VKRSNHLSYRPVEQDDATRKKHLPQTLDL
jgi:hypothetical protein